MTGFEPPQAIPNGGFKVVLADPPWSFSHYSAKGTLKSAQVKYSCMQYHEIAEIPVADWMADDCVLVLWGTWPMAAEAMQLVEDWGFTYKTGGVWAKQSKTGQKWAFGTGYIFRSASEFYLVGTRGKPHVKSRSERNLIVAPVREHSRKPDEMYSMIERLWDGPYVELFSRSTAPGWTVAGNQTGTFEVAT